MNARPCPIRRHHGLSLLEVILALAILGGAMVVLGQLMRTGMNSAETAQDLTRAEFICQSILSEVVAGLRAPDSIGETEYEEDPIAWRYSISVEPTSLTDVVELRVTVTRNTEQANPASTTLVRWIPDPASDLAAAEILEAMPEDESAEGTTDGR